jgi:Protein of unknown function (DUF2384)
MEAYPALLDKANRLQDELAVIHEKINGLVRTARSMSIALPELHDETTGRIDAQKLADFMGLPLKRLAEALGLNYKAVHRNPSAESIQEALQPVKRVMELLFELFPRPESVRIWINTPHPDLGGRTALDTILARNSRAVITILENALAGIPS